MTIAVYSSICEEDACWIDQYLAEVSRLGLRFAINLDRCSIATGARLIAHHRCLGHVFQSDPAIEFNEMHKQKAFDIVVRAGFKWAMAWDVDETYERDAPRKLAEIDAMDADYIDTPWHNLWNDPRYVRIDGPFASGHRVKFYNLKRRQWRFTHMITNGPKIVDEKGDPLADCKNPVRERSTRYDLNCLHWGMLTREMRLQHKERWDRIYSKAVGSNPYGFWNYACDEIAYPPEVMEHDYGLPGSF
jgi:hypothetical protein